MIGALINLIVWLLVVGILYWVVVYIVDSVPIPQPANRIIKIVLTVLIALVVIMLLLQMAGIDVGTDLPRVAPNP